MTFDLVTFGIFHGYSWEELIRLSELVIMGAWVFAAVFATGLYDVTH